MFQPLPAEQLLAVQAEFERRLLPAIMRATSTNGSLLIASLKNQNKAVTAANLIAAASALRDSIDWEVPPKKQGNVQMSPDTSRRNFAKESDDKFGESHVISDALTKMDLEKAKPVVAEAKALVSCHSSRPHSKTFKERAALQSTLDKLLAQYPAPTLKQAESIKAALQAQQAKFPA